MTLQLTPRSYDRKWRSTITGTVHYYMQMSRHEQDCIFGTQDQDQDQDLQLTQDQDQDLYNLEQTLILFSINENLLMPSHCAPYSNGKWQCTICPRSLYCNLP